MIESASPKVLNFNAFLLHSTLYLPFRLNLVVRHFPVSVNRVGSDLLSQFHQNSFRFPDPDDEVRPSGLEILPELGDGLDEKLGAEGTRLVEAGGGFAVVARVEAVNGENGEALVVGGGETLVVVDAEVVPEPDDGGSAEGGGGGGVDGAAGDEGERGVEGVGGEGGFEGGDSGRRRREGGKGEVCEVRGLRWDLDLVWMMCEEV